MDNPRIMTRVMIVHDCTECSKFNEEPPYYECTLSDTRHYEKEDENWMEWLMQYCPLECLEDIMDSSFKKGQEYEKHKKDTLRNVRLSTEKTKWLTPHEFLDKLTKDKKQTQG